jgi:predicted transcriptional regulator
MSIRLDKETTALLEETAEAVGISKAEVIRRSVLEYCPRTLNRMKPYDLIRDLLEKRGSGRGDLSIKGEEILRSRLGHKKS